MLTTEDVTTKPKRKTTTEMSIPKTSRRQTNRPVSGGRESKPTATTPRKINHTRPAGPTSRPTRKSRTERPTNAPANTTRGQSEEDMFVVNMTITTLLLIKMFKASDMN